jgi:DNA-binding NtrC family response regulator
MSLIQELPHVRLVSSRPSERSVEREALLAARGDANILIVGDRGPGKAALARLIHQSSSRAAKSFAILKCDRLSDELIRAELFGYLETTPSGASMNTPSLLSADFRGTVFLDEIGALGAATQARLLRFLERAEHVPVDIRLIASTSVNLQSQVNAGLFLADLHARLSVRTLAAGSVNRMAAFVRGRRAGVSSL